MYRYLPSDHTFFSYEVKEQIFFIKVGRNIYFLVILHNMIMRYMKIGEGLSRPQFPSESLLEICSMNEFLTYKLWLQHLVLWHPFGLSSFWAGTRNQDHCCSFLYRTVDKCPKRITFTFNTCRFSLAWLCR